MKMIDVLCKLAKGEIEEGAILVIEHFYYKLDDKGVFREDTLNYAVGESLTDRYYLDEEFLNEKVYLIEADEYESERKNKHNEDD